MDYFSAIKKEQTIDPRKKLDESPENYAKWNEPIPKSYIPFDSIYITFSEWQNYRSGEQILLRDRDGEWAWV